MAYETKEAYEAYAKRQAAILSWELKVDTSHGRYILCPRCHRSGILDLTMEYSFPEENSIYYSTVYNRWECTECTVIDFG